jgi:hypothetical protein
VCTRGSDRALLGGPSTSPLEGSVRRSLVFYVGFYAASLCGYLLTLKWAFAFTERLDSPGWWDRFWVLRLSHDPIAPWENLKTLGTFIIASIPIGLVIARFGGRHAPIATMGIQLTGLAIAILALLVYAGGPWRAPKAIYAVELLTLLLVLPTTVWLLRQLPSNNRWRGP